MRVLVAWWSRRAIRVEHLPERRATHRRAMTDEPAPVERPAEIAHRFAWQSEREVEAGDPRPRCGEQLLEARPVGKRVDRVENERAHEPSARDGDGFARPGSRSEVDTEDRERTRHAYLRTETRCACYSTITR